MNYAIIWEITIWVAGRQLHPIVALCDMPKLGVKKGDWGGFIEDTSNLQENAWVAERAMVWGSAVVSGNALIYGDARIFGNAKIRGNAKVGGFTEIFGDSIVEDNANIHNTVCTWKDFGTCGNLIMAYRDAEVEATWKHIIIKDEAHVFGDADITDNVILQKKASVGGKLKLYGNCTIEKPCHYEIVKTNSGAARKVIYTAKVFNLEKAEVKDKSIKYEVPITISNKKESKDLLTSPAFVAAV